jgi:hypothetical protein
MDFQKAFDKVPHKRLIRKATNYMLDNPLLEWIEDFITGRTQKVSKTSSSCSDVDFKLFGFSIFRF